MEHFSTQKWVDFIRKLTDPETTEEMQRHINDECGSCLRNLKLWGGVMEQAEQHKQMEPPGASVQAVKASFRVRKIVPFPSGKLDLAMLQFDSDRQPMAAGMRSGQPMARQMLYRSGTVCIDMRMQPTPGSESIVLVGQLLDSMNPGHGISGIPVSLLSKGDTVSHKQTNHLGEFDFGLEKSGDLQLVFGIGDSRTIVVAVPEGLRRLT
jgi:hypothetical protein